METATILDLMVGKEMMVDTDMKIPVKLKIHEIKEHHHSRQIGESNAANDWWPETQDWVTYLVTYTNGASKEFSNLSEIKILK